MKAALKIVTSRLAASPVRSGAAATNNGDRRNPAFPPPEIIPTPQPSSEHFGDLRVLGASREAEEDVLQAAFALADAAQFVHRPGGDQSALMDDPDPIAQ